MGRQIVPIAMMTAAGRRIVTDWKQGKYECTGESHGSERSQACKYITLMTTGSVYESYLLVLFGFVTQNVAGVTSVVRSVLDVLTATPKLYCMVLPVSIPSSMKNA